MTLDIILCKYFLFQKEYICKIEIGDSVWSFQFICIPIIDNLQAANLKCGWSKSSS